jgi:hypothetical protein
VCKAQQKLRLFAAFAQGYLIFRDRSLSASGSEQAIAPREVVAHISPASCNEEQTQEGYCDEMA